MNRLPRTTPSDLAVVGILASCAAIACLVAFAAFALGASPWIALVCGAIAYTILITIA